MSLKYPLVLVARLTCGWWSATTKDIQIHQTVTPADNNRHSLVQHGQVCEAAAVSLQRTACL